MKRRFAFTVLIGFCLASLTPVIPGLGFGCAGKLSAQDAGAGVADPPVGTVDNGSTTTELDGRVVEDVDTQDAGQAVVAAENGPGDKPVKEKKDQEYVRLAKDKKGRDRAMQTAIVRFEGLPGTPYEGRIVDLFGVVHIGQDEYYADINQRLSTYDAVLYELVAPDGTRIRPEDLEKSRSALAQLQTGMKRMLNLEYQLEKVDYMAENFVHADMSPDEFMQDMKKRGDSLPKMFARMMGASMATSVSSGGDAGMLMALFSNDRSKQLKRVMSRQLMDIDAATAGMQDAEGNDTLIKGRNEKAFSVLKQELDAGKKSLSVFYGAGHLPDMAERLKKDFQMKPIETTWLDAWDLTRN